MEQGKRQKHNVVRGEGEVAHPGHLIQVGSEVAVAQHGPSGLRRRSGRVSNQRQIGALRGHVGRRGVGGHGSLQGERSRWDGWAADHAGAVQFPDGDFAAAALP